MGNLAFYTTLQPGLLNAWIPSFTLTAIEFVYMLLYREEGKRAVDTSWYTLEERKNAKLSMAFQSAILLLSLFVPLRLGTPWFIAGCPLFAVSIAGFIAAVHAYAHTPMQETVTRGIYRMSRNPMYLFFHIGALGCCVASASLWLLLVIVPFILVTHRVILGEERYCEETYGRSYLQTKGKARVWRNDQEKTDTRHERKSPVKNLDISILFFIFIQSISKQFRYTDRKPIEQKAIMKKKRQRQILNKAATTRSLRMTTTVTIAFVLRFAGTGEARADENPDTATLHIDAEQIVVTATKTAKELSGVTASVEVITEKEIQRMGAANLKDIFEKTPGTSLQYGTFPSASSASKSSVSFRGIGASGSLFLVDGRRLAGEVKNPYDLDRIPAAMIERIEIIKGPMSVLYGADALGGVINIITKKPEKGAAGSVGLRVGANTDGDDARINGNISLGGKTGKFGYSVLVNAMHTKPYTETEHTSTLVRTPGGLVPPSQHPDPAIRRIQDSYAVDVTYREKSEVYTVGGQLTYEPAPSTQIGAEFNYFREERNGTYRSTFFPTGISPVPGQTVPAFDTPVNSRDKNWRRDFGLNLTSGLGDNLMLHLRAYNSYYQKRNTTTAANWQDAGFSSEEASANLGMNANVDIWSYEAYAVSMQGASHQITAGGEYRDENRKATVFNQAGTYETRSVVYKAVYLQDEWKITGSLNAILGVRYDWISNSDNKSTFKVGLVNKFSDLFVLRGNFAQGYRAPDIRELYIRKNTPAGAQRGAMVIDAALGKGVYDLKPEFVNSYEIGLGGKKGGLHYSATLFLNDIEDKIAEVTKNPGTPRAYHTFENVSEARTKGVELAAGYTSASGIGVEASWHELSAKDKSTGRKLEFNPDRQISGRIGYENGGLEVWTMGKYVSTQYAANAEGNHVDSYFIVDTGISYAFSGDNPVRLYGGVNNIFDEKVDKLLGSNVGPCFYAGLWYDF